MKKILLNCLFLNKNNYNNNNNNNWLSNLKISKGVGPRGSILLGPNDCQ